MTGGDLKRSDGRIGKEGCGKSQFAKRKEGSWKDMGAKRGGYPGTQYIYEASSECAQWKLLLM